MPTDFPAAPAIVTTVHQILKSTGRPMTFDGLTESGERTGQRLAPEDVRVAVWSLYEAGIVAIRPDWTIKLTSPIAPRRKQRLAHGAKKPSRRTRVRAGV